MSDSTRRLAAILFADIVGYTALMQHDEQAALEKLARFKNVLEYHTAEHRGHIIQYYGDAGLVVFDSPLEAVACAKTLQEAFHLAPEVPVRIGIHLGDVVFQEGNVFGDSVNIASRIESMGVPGAVLLSQTVRGQIKNHPEFHLASLGSFEFKNVDEPMEVFALVNEGFPVPKREEMVGKLKTPATKNATQSTSWKKWTLVATLLVAALTAVLFFKNSTGTNLSKEEISIAVLPFANLNNDPEQDYFSDGITDEIRTRLAQVGEMKVISRASSMFFKGKNVSLKQVGKELNVRYILSGSIQKSGDIVKINVELNDTQSDRIIWSSPAYNQEIEDIFALQSQLSRDLVGQLKVRLTEQEKQRLTKTKEVDPKIYNLELSAKYQSLQRTNNGRENALLLANKILALDSANATAYAIIGHYHATSTSWLSTGNPQNALEKSRYYLEKAIFFGPESPQVYYALGAQKLFLEWDFAGAENAFRKAVVLGGVESAGLYFFLNNLKKAKMVNAKELELEPFGPAQNAWKGQIAFFLGHEQEAIHVFEEGFRLYHHPQFYKDLGKLYLNAGQPAQAIQTLTSGMDNFRIRPPAMLGDLAIACFKNKQPEKGKLILQEMKALWYSNKGGSPAFFIGQVYAALGEKDPAFEWLEKSFAAHDVEMIWLKMEPQLKSLHDDPRYKDLLRRMGFPENIEG